MNTEKLELFAVLELFGHSKISGRISEQSFGSDTFIRVDVPETETQPSFTRLLNPKAIYAINPVTEGVMLHMAKQIQNKPIEAWDIKKMNDKLLALVSESKKQSFGGPGTLDDDFMEHDGV